MVQPATWNRMFMAPRSLAGAISLQRMSCPCLIEGMRFTCTRGKQQCYQVHGDPNWGVHAV